MYYINKEILKQDGKGEKNTIIMGDWKGVAEDIVIQHGLGRKNQRSNAHQLLWKKCTLLLKIHYLRSLREDFTPNKYQKIENDITWPTYCEAQIQKEHEGSADIAWSRYSVHNLLVAKISTRLKKIIRLKKEKPKWDLEKLCAQWHESAWHSTIKTSCKMGMWKCSGTISRNVC